MALRRENGILKSNKGDTIRIPFKIKGLIPVSLYCIYFQINFPEPIIKRQEITTDNEGNCRIDVEITCHESNVLPKKYTYGVKTCRDGCEDTIYTGTLEIEQKYVEGD